jgi:alkylated DNA repair protein (DNA oxidative demethylase)
MQPTLFNPSELTLAPGTLLLRSFAEPQAAALIAAIEQIAAAAPFRHMVTPGGHAMSAAMTNCGAAGWVTSRTGYRYTAADPETGDPWPAMPAIFTSLATRAAAEAGYPNFTPDACLINRYLPGARMSLHQDRDEASLKAPVVSISLGLPATFLWGGQSRAERPQRIPLHHGDAFIWGGPARLTFHGIAPLKDGAHPILGRQRLNLTFRKAL